MVFYGDGAGKVREVIRHSNAMFIEDVSPSAKFMIPLAMDAFVNGNFEDTAYFEPFYLKDFVATIPKRKVVTEAAALH